MDELETRARQGHRLIQVGMLVFLFSLFVGLAIPSFAAPRLGLSTHLLGIMQSLFLMVLGLVWPRLQLSSAGSAAAFVLALYGCFAPLTANLLAGLWAAGNTLLPMAAGQAHGSSFQETLIALLLRTGGASLIAVSIVVSWGLKGGAERPRP